MAETVLIVEDQPGLAEAYKSAVENQYDVRVAHSGSDALDRFDDAVDVVILDRRMPGMSGDEVLTALDETVDFSVAMVTAVDPGEDIVDMPVDAYVTKPISNDELRTLIDELLSLREDDEQLRTYRRTLTKLRALEAVYKTESAAYETLVERRAELQAALDIRPSELTDGEQFWLS